MKNQKNKTCQMAAAACCVLLMPSCKEVEDTVVPSKSKVEVYKNVSAQQIKSVELYSMLVGYTLQGRESGYKTGRLAMACMVETIDSSGGIYTVAVVFGSGCTNPQAILLLANSPPPLITHGWKCPENFLNSLSITSLSIPLK
ncbi:MAG: hypothetical protein JNK66_05190 [Chitinophagales bacterium]|nr:hypothetical protein [Chitinophagales bacterium]